MNASRRLLYGTLITVAVGSAVGRIASTQLVFEPSLYHDEKNPRDRLTRIWPDKRPPQMPTFSSNDRSRWATVRALVDEGTYAVGKRKRANILASAVAAVANCRPLEAAVTAQAGFFVRARKSDEGIIF